MPYYLPRSRARLMCEASTSVARMGLLCVSQPCSVAALPTLAGKGHFLAVSGDR
jgi:hypothetical protein